MKFQLIELKSSNDKRSIKFPSIVSATIVANAVYKKYQKRPILCVDGVETDYEINESYDSEPHDIYLADIIILGLDLAMSEKQVAWNDILPPYFESNMSLVNQYKAGNTKSLNALIGKIMKDNRDIDPKELRKCY